MYSLSDEIYKIYYDEEEILIRHFNREDSVSEITDLLHRSYKKLADLGFRYMATHQDDAETEKRLSKGISYLAFHKEKIIATVTLYYNSETHQAEFYNRKEVAHFGQFGVDPKYQKKGIGNKIMDIIETKAKNSGASEIALDTAEGAEHLIRFYEKRGYKFIQYVQWDVTNYRSIIMSKKLTINN